MCIDFGRLLGTLDLFVERTIESTSYTPRPIKCIYPQWTLRRREDSETELGWSPTTEEPQEPDLMLVRGFDFFLFRSEVESC